MSFSLFVSTVTLVTCHPWVSAAKVANHSHFHFDVQGGEIKEVTVYFEPLERAHSPAEPLKPSRIKVLTHKLRKARLG